MGEHNSFLTLLFEGDSHLCVNKHKTCGNLKKINSGNLVESIIT
jgi:hypothetical protein